MRTGIDAELAEYARTEVVLIFRQYLLFLTVFRLYGFTRHFDGVVGTSHLTQAASYAMMLVLLVVGHRQRTPEAFGEFQCLPVLRILFGGLLPAENGHSGFHARQQGADTVYEAAYIRVMFFIIFHYFIVLDLSEWELCSDATSASVKSVVRIRQSTPSISGLPWR